MSRTEYGIRWPVGQIRSKHSSARSQYLHCMKNRVATLYKLDTEDPAACVRMVEYILNEDHFNCSPNGYEVTFSASFFQTISVRC